MELKKNHFFIKNYRQLNNYNNLFYTVIEDIYRLDYLMTYGMSSSEFTKKIWFIIAKRQ